MNIRHILKNEKGSAGFGIKIFLLVVSILIPFVLVNTLILRNLYQQVAAAINNEEHLAMVGAGFFSIFFTNVLLALVVAALAVVIVFWAVSPWEKLGRKIIRILGENSPSPRKTDKIHYAMDLLDKIDIK